VLTQLQNPSLNHPVSYSKGYKLIVSLVFILSISLYSVFSSDSAFQHISLIVAAMLGGYMAMTIGANDIANTMGPAVGSNAVSMPAAISIAIVFELMGAIFAGGEVVSTIKSHIINVELIDDTRRFVWLMLAALAAAGIWLNVATAAKAPVSTTQAIVGSIVGAAIAAEGLALVDWSTLITITFAWLLSPVLGGALAAWLVYIMTATIIDKENKLLAAKRWVPTYVALMVWAFFNLFIRQIFSLFFYLKRVLFILLFRLKIYRFCGSRCCLHC
jgi:PiT family inorganic phosphate transporter